MAETPNHQYNRPSEGATNWNQPLNTNFDDLDVDVEIRGSGPPDSGATTYDSRPGSKYLDTDTGLVYQGTDTGWTPAFVIGVHRNDADVLARIAPAEVLTLGGLNTDYNTSGSVVFGRFTTTEPGVRGAVISGGGRYDQTNSTSQENIVADHYGTVGGGVGNRAGTQNGDLASDQFATVSGGRNNDALNTDVTIGGGRANTADGQLSTIGGGRDNYASGRYAAISGGWDNTASGESSTTAGGFGNSATALYAAVGGGRDNSAIAEFATIAGGGPSDLTNPGTTNNVVYDDYGTIGGGGNNQAGSDDGNTQDPSNATYATVSGGDSNTASSNWATVGGGLGNTASNTGATVAGGQHNTASGLASFAAGYDAEAVDGYTFVWSGNAAATTTSAASGQFVVNAGGGMYLGDDSGPSGDFRANNNEFIRTSTGATLTDGGAWTDSSSRAVKTDIDQVDPPSILNDVESLSVSEWSYEAESDGVRHLGPMAEDFYETFELGNDDEHIAALDTAGVALAAIQGLSKELDEKVERIEEVEKANETLEEENQKLKAQNEELQERLRAVEEHLDLNPADDSQ